MTWRYLRDALALWVRGYGGDAAVVLKRASDLGDAALVQPAKAKHAEEGGTSQFLDNKAPFSCSPGRQSRKPSRSPVRSLKGSGQERTGGKQSPGGLTGLRHPLFL